MECSRRIVREDECRDRAAVNIRFEVGWGAGGNVEVMVSGADSDGIGGGQVADDIEGVA